MIIHLSARCSHSDNIVRRTQVYANEHSILIPTCEKSYIDINLCSHGYFQYYIQLCYACHCHACHACHVYHVCHVCHVSRLPGLPGLSCLSVTPARSVMLCTIFYRGIVDIPHRWRQVAIHPRASVVAQQRPRPLRRRSAAAGRPPPSSR